MLEILAILFTPPKIIINVKTVNIIPIISLFALKVELKAAAIVLDCTELNANPKHIIIRTENVTPIHFFFSPFSM